MHKILIKSIIFFLFIGFGVMSCKQNQKDQDAQNKFFKEIYAKAININKEGKQNASLTFFDSAYKAQKYVPYIGKYFFYTFKGMCYNNESNYEMFNQYADSALLVIEENKLTLQYADEFIHALMEKGHALSNFEQYEKAYDYYLKAKQFGETILNTCSLHELSYDLAMILFKQGRYQEAANSFELAYKEATTCIEDSVKYGMALPPGYRMQELLDNTGLCFYKLNLPDSALLYYNKTLSFIESNPNFVGSPLMVQTAKAVVYGNLGSVYKNLGNLNLAKELLNKSITLNSLPGGDFSDAQKSKLKLAAIYFDECDYELMLEALNTLKSNNKRFNDKEIERDINKQMYMYFDKVENVLQSYYYYQKWISLRDSIELSNKKKYNTDINNYINMKERQYQINLLKKDNLLNRIYLFSGGVISLLGLAITILVFLIYNRNRKQNILIKKQSKLLEESNLAKDRILGVVAHDLRNPLSGIEYVSETMLKGENINTIYKDWTKIINDTAKRTLVLINELIAVNETNKELIKEKIDLTLLVKDSVNLMKSIADKKQQFLETEVGTLPIFAKVDSEKINRVLQNLIDNAIKFSLQGATINIKIYKSIDKAIITVKDTGIGIPQNLLNEIFNQFTYAQRKGTNGEKSFGLGLSICKKIIELHGGTIRIESEVNKGSTFYIYLPLENQ